jgi:hypothetical protein
MPGGTFAPVCSSLLNNLGEFGEMVDLVRRTAIRVSTY